MQKKYKNTIKKLTLFFIALFCAIGANAQLSSNEKAFANRIKQYITNEGYRPEIDKDEDVTFKKEGTLYWVRVRQEDEGYYYVTLNHAPVDCEDANIYAVQKAVNEVTKNYKVGKAYYSETNNDVPLSVEGFYKNANDFTQYFSRFMSILENMDEDLTEYYEEFDQ